MTNAINGPSGGVDPLQYLLQTNGLTAASALSLASLGNPSAQAASDPDGDGDIDSGGGDANDTMKQLLSKIGSLEQSDPKAASQALTSIASQLSSLASQAGAGSAQGKALTQLAGDFTQAAKTGDLSGLKLKGASGGHHHHHGGAKAGGVGDLAGSSIDLAASSIGAASVTANSAIEAYQRFQQQDTNNSVNSILSQALSSLG
jgi:hypothetical protein